MAEEKTIADRVRKLVADQLGKDIEIVTPETTFEQLQADSLDVVEAVIGIDDEFDVNLDDTEFGHTSTVGDLIAAVEKANG